MADAGEKWGKKHERQFCHGGKGGAHECTSERQGEQAECCAYRWPTWGAISYFLEQLGLIEMGMTPPAHWSLADWRRASRIKDIREEFQRAERE